MKQIVVTTDLSTESEVACEVAKELAEPLFAAVNLLAIMEEPLLMPVMGGPVDAPPLIDLSAEEEMKKRAAEELEFLSKKYFADLPHKSTVQPQKGGSVAATISGFAEELDAHLIVMATHGRTGLSRAVLGSVAEQVVRHATCPVVLVPIKKEK